MAPLLLNHKLNPKIIAGFRPDSAFFTEKKIVRKTLRENIRETFLNLLI